MTARAVWAGIAVALVVLPALPLPSWAGATDTGPAAWGHSLAAWAWGGAILAVVAGLAGRLARASALRTTVRFPHIPRRVFLGALALWIAAWAVALGRIGFAANPHLIDEIAQLFQARVFADGRLAAPQPALPEFFLFQLSSPTAAGWVTEFPPGHGLLLAGGLLGRAEWLVNPLLAGLCLPLVYALARGLYGPKTGRVAAFLWATCAWVGFMAGSYMNHMSAVFWALIAWVAVFGAGRSHHAVAGFALAALFATRPLDAVIAAIPIGLWILLLRRWRALPLLAAGALPILVLLGLYNARLFGSPSPSATPRCTGPRSASGSTPIRTARRSPRPWP